MLIVAIILFVLGLAIAAGVAVFALKRRAGIMLPSERYRVLIVMIVGGALALSGTALLIYDLLGRYLTG